MMGCGNFRRKILFWLNIESFDANNGHIFLTTNYPNSLSQSDFDEDNQVDNDVASV